MARLSVIRRRARLKLNRLRPGRSKRPYTDEELALLAIVSPIDHRVAMERRERGPKKRAGRVYDVGEPPVPRAPEWRLRMLKLREKLSAMWARGVDVEGEREVLRSMRAMLREPPSVEEDETDEERQPEDAERGASEKQGTGGQLDHL